MRRLTIETKSRKYGTEPGDQVTEEWVTTHEITVPDEVTLASVMESIAETMKPKKY